jgi:putative aldouronate transport system permease protein
VAQRVRPAGAKSGHEARTSGGPASGPDGAASGPGGAALAATSSRPGSGTAAGRYRGPSLLARFKRDWVMLALVTPGLLYFLTFHYVPLLGYVTAFQDYRPFVGFIESPFVGWGNFQAMAADPRFWQAIANTLIIALLQLVLYFPAPLGLALLLNGVISTRTRRFLQSVVYLPHFLSWVIVVALFQQLLGGAGAVNHVLRDLALPTTDVMSNASFFKWLAVIQLVWKETGWGTIIYLAALLGIEASLYEAAAADGANRWRRLWHVTLPGIVGVTILLLILRLGNILSVGFEQMLLQRTAVGPEGAEVLDTYVYFQGILGGQWGITAAAGLVKGIIGMGLVLAANKLAHRMGQDGVYR